MLQLCLLWLQDAFVNNKSKESERVIYILIVFNSAMTVRQKKVKQKLLDWSLYFRVTNNINAAADVKGREESGGEDSIIFLYYSS